MRLLIRNILKYTIGLPFLILVTVVCATSGIAEFVVDGRVTIFKGLIGILKPFKE